MKYYSDLKVRPDILKVWQQNKRGANQTSQTSTKTAILNRRGKRDLFDSYDYAELTMWPRTTILKNSKITSIKLHKPKI